MRNRKFVPNTISVGETDRKQKVFRLEELSKYAVLLLFFRLRRSLLLPPKGSDPSTTRVSRISSPTED